MVIYSVFFSILIELTPTRIGCITTSLSAFISMSLCLFPRSLFPYVNYQNWLYHDATGFGHRVLESSHALPVMTWTRAPDSGSAFLALFPPFKDSLVAKDGYDITCKTKSSYRVWSVWDDALRKEEREKDRKEERKQGTKKERKKEKKKARKKERNKETKKQRNKETKKKRRNGKKKVWIEKKGGKEINKQQNK